MKKIILTTILYCILVFNMSYACSISGSQLVCVGSNITLSTTGCSGGSWSSSNTSFATIDASSGVVTGVGGGNLTISYTVSGATTTFSLTVNTTAPNATITGGSTLCYNGASETLANSVSGGLWYSDTNNSVPASIDPVTGLVTDLGTVAHGHGTDTFYYTTGCGTDAKKTFGVNIIPSPIIPYNSETVPIICIGTTAIAYDVARGGGFSSSNTAVATITGGGGTITPVSVGTATISYGYGGCSTYDATYTITINPSTDQPAAITGTFGICVSASGSVADATSGGTWSSSTTSLATITSDGVYTGVFPGKDTIIYTGASGCIATKQVTVSGPTPIHGNTSICVGNKLILTDSVFDLTWSSSNTSIATVYGHNENSYIVDGIVYGVSAGSVTITYKQSSSGCTQTYPITINTNPISSISGSSGVCMGSTVSYTDSSSGGTWSDITTNSSIDPSSGIDLGITAGIDTIKYTLSTGCYVSKPITVNSLPAAITGTENFCVSTTSTLADATSGGTWSSSSTTIATVGSSTGIVSGISGGTSNISYTLTSTSCYQVQVVTVNGVPTSIGGTLTACFPGTTTLSDGSTGGTWTSGTTTVATVDANGDITSVSQGTTIVTYSNGCGANATAVVTVNANPASITGNAYLCVGSTTALGETSTGGTWTSGTTTVATVDASGDVSGVLQGTSIITYSNGCGTAATVTVTVNANPASITGNAYSCVGSTTALGETSTGGTWTSGTTTVATVDASGDVSGVLQGTSIITYSNGCGTAATANVTVNAAAAAISGTLTVCAGSTTALSDVSTGSATWTSGTTSVAKISSTGVVAGFAGGTSTITFSNGCGSPVTAIVTVDAPASHVCAEAIPNVVCDNSGTLYLQADLGSGSTGDLSYSWSGPNSYSNTNATTASFSTYSVTGVYTLSVTTGVCSPETALVRVIVTPCAEYRISGSANSNNQNNSTISYTMYPNPTTGTISIVQSVAVDETVAVKIINSVGELFYSGDLVFSGGKSHLSLVNATPGIYLVEFIDNKGNKEAFNVAIER